MLAIAEVTGWPCHPVSCRGLSIFSQYRTLFPTCWHHCGGEESVHHHIQMHQALPRSSTCCVCNSCVTPQHGSRTRMFTMHMLPPAENQSSRHSTYKVLPSQHFFSPPPNFFPNGSFLHRLSWWSRANISSFASMPNSELDLAPQRLYTANFLSALKVWNPWKKQQHPVSSSGMLSPTKHMFTLYYFTPNLVWQLLG